MTARRIILIIVVLVLVVWGGKVCIGKLQSSMINQDSPEGAVKAAIMAMESKDAAKVAAYFTPIPSGTMKSRMAHLFTVCDKIGIENLRTAVVYQEGLAAHVEVTWDTVLHVGEQRSVEHSSRTVKLIADSGKWWINEAF